MNTQPQHIQGNATGATKPFEVKMECGDTLGLTIRGQIMKGSVYGANVSISAFAKTLPVHMVQNNFQVLEALLWTYSSEPATYHSPPSMDDPPSYTCHHCRAWFPTEGKHEQHIQLTHPYPCSKYWRVFTTVSLLQLCAFQRHVRKKCPTNVRNFEEFKENPIMVDEEVSNAT
ncbi:hypothetical protein V8E51_008636 [Hyaloscypha variabilis]